MKKPASKFLRNAMVFLTLAILVSGCSSKTTTTAADIPLYNEILVKYDAPGIAKKDKPTNDAPIIPQNYKEGKYSASAEGRKGVIKVNVTFSKNKIDKIEVVEQSETEGLGDLAITEVADKIIAAQHLKVDTVSGATVSSQAVIDAVAAAVDQAGGNSAALKGLASAKTALIPQNYKEGKYLASAEGRNGAVKVDVTFSKDKITKIEVVEQSETEGLGDLALNEVAKKIISDQSLKVDIVSGASVSSKAMIDAVSSAVDQAGGNSAALK